MVPVMHPSSNPLILCPDASGKGGIASVAESWDIELNKRGIQADYFYTTTSERPLRRPYEIAQFVRFLNRIRTRPRPSLFHVNIGSGHSFARKAPYLAVCQALGIPTIVHIHGPINLIRHYEAHPRQRRVFTALLKRTTRVIMVSALNQQTIRQWFNETINIHTLYNPPVLRNLPSKLQPRAGRTTVSFLGLFIADKGIWELLEAAENVHAKARDAHFVLAGDGPEFQAIQREVEARGLGDYVSLPGWVTGEERKAIWAQSDIFCLPSHSEGFPVSIVEAMSLGVAIVASDVGGIPEAIVDGEHGLLTPVGDSTALSNALLSLIVDPKQRRTLAAAAQTRAQQEFSPETIVDQLIAHWNEVAESEA